MFRALTNCGSGLMGRRKTIDECIDKEAFKKSVEERYCKPCKAEKKDHNGCWCRACWVDDMLDEVECFQPADVAPVVYGRWMHEETEGGFHIWRCSRCGSGMNDNPEGIDLYCYHCGAKMDGGDNDAAD